MSILITKIAALKENFMGIILCGLNGTGKSTLGKALAEKLHFHFIDIENLYFPKTDPNYIYASPRTREDVKRLLLHEMTTHENFILAAVKGDYGEDIYSFFRCVILIGNRMLAGGDLHEQEEKFFRLVESRDENTVEEWIKSLECPVIQIDGTKPIDENTNFIIELIQNNNLFAKEMGIENDL